MGHDPIEGGGHRHAGHGLADVTAADAHDVRHPGRDGAVGVDPAQDRGPRRGQVEGDGRRPLGGGVEAHALGELPEGAVEAGERGRLGDERGHDRGGHLAHQPRRGVGHDDPVDHHPAAGTAPGGELPGAGPVHRPRREAAEHAGQAAGPVGKGRVDLADGDGPASRAAHGDGAVGGEVEGVHGRPVAGVHAEEVGRRAGSRRRPRPPAGRPGPPARRRPGRGPRRRPGGGRRRPSRRRAGAGRRPAGRAGRRGGRPGCAGRGAARRRSCPGDAEGAEVHRRVRVGGDGKGVERGHGDDAVGHEPGGVDSGEPGRQPGDDRRAEGRPCVAGGGSEQGPAGARHAAQGRAHGGIRQAGGADGLRHRHRPEEGAAVDRRGHRDQLVGGQGHEVAGVDPAGRLQGQSGGVEPVVGGPDLGQLHPRRVHEVLLVAPHDLGAQAGGHPRPGIDVELGEPRGRVVGELVAVHVPRAVERRADGEGRFPARGLAGAGVDRGAQSGAQARVDLLEAEVVARGGAQGAVHVDHRAGVGLGQLGHPGLGHADVHGHPPQPGRALVGAEAGGEGLEVALRPGRELPVEVDRQPGGRPAPRRPHLRFRIGCAAQAADHAGVEGGHHAREVAGAGPEPAGAEQAGDVAVGVGLELGGEGGRGDGGVGEELAVGPERGRRGIGQLGAGVGRALDAQDRE